jgi:hypothetical protein
VGKIAGEQLTKVDDDGLALCDNLLVFVVAVDRCRHGGLARALLDAQLTEKSTKGGKRL